MKAENRMDENTKKPIIIKYVALGDAFSAGYNSKIGFPTNGYMDKNGEIKGLCFPSMLANFLNDTSNLQVESFYNFAICNASCEFLEAFYSNNKKVLKKMGSKLDLIQSIDWSSNNPFNNFFSPFLKDWNIRNNDFQYINEKIAEANLITLTIGFNDFFSNLPFQKIFLLTKLNGEARDRQISVIKKDIENLSIVIENKIISLISTIRKINNKAKIIITSYSPLLLNLRNTISSFLNTQLSDQFEIFDYLQINLNKTIAESAKKCRIDFININDTKYWEENKKYLFENIFSIYPTERGYKKIAMDIYVKLFLNFKMLKNDLNNHSFTNEYISDTKYWEDNIYSYNPISQCSENLSLFKMIYGKNKNEILFRQNKSQRYFNNLLHNRNRITDFCSIFIRYSKLPISEMIKKIISQKFIYAPEQYESIAKILNFLTNERRSKEAILILLKDHKVDDIVYIIECILQKKALSKKIINYKLIKQELNNFFKNEQNMVYDVLKYLFNSGLINDSKKEFKDIIHSLIKDSLNTSFLTYLFNIKNNQKFNKVKEYLSSLNSFSEFTDFFVESLINYSDVYVKLRNFDQLWKHFIIKNKYNLLFIFDKMLVEITNEENIDHTANFFIDAIKSSLRVELDAKDYKVLKNAINNILNICKNSPKYLNNVFLKFLDNIRNLSLYKLILHSKTNSKKTFKLSNLFSLNIFLVSSIKLLRNLFIIKKIVNKNKI
ncbi:SGNH/GDSL hydrolase family protein [Mycoplasma sp. 327]